MITTTESPRRSTASRANVYDVAVLAMLAVVGCVYIYTSATVESLGSDTSTYYSLAKTLLEQHRYWFNFEPHTFYPPGFPVLLAALMVVVGDSFTALVKCLVGIYLVGAAGLYYFVKRRSGPAVAAAIVALVVTSYVFYFLATVGMHSDGPYFAVSAFALLCFEIGNSATDTARRRVAHVMVALLAAYLLLVRSIGVTFVGALIVWMIAPDRLLSTTGKERPANRVRQWLPSAVLALTVFGGWSYWVGHHQPTGPANDYAHSYSRQILKQDPHQLDSPPITLQTLPGRVIRMAITRAQNATMMVFNLPGLTLRKSAALMLAFSITVAAGFVASLIAEGALLDWYVLLYAGVLLLYPYDEGMRYLYPIQPFLILYAIKGIDVIRAGLKRTVPSLAIEGRTMAFAKAAVLAAILGMGLYQVSMLARTNLHPDTSAFTNAGTVRSSDWILRNSNSGDVVMDDQDSIVHRLTGRKTFHFPLTTDPNILRETIANNHVTFVVVPDQRRYEYYDPSPATRFDRLKQLSPGLFVPVYRFNGGTIYRVQRGA